MLCRSKRSGGALKTGPGTRNRGMVTEDAPDIPKRCASNAFGLYRMTVHSVLMRLCTPRSNLLREPHYSIIWHPVPRIKCPRTMILDVRGLLSQICIITIQGLWANPNLTWKRNGIIWLRDFLPSVLPGATIMSFEPIAQHSHLDCFPLRFARKVWHWILLLLLISITNLYYFRKALLLAVAGLMLGVGSLMFRRSYRRLAATPTTEIRDQARELLQCIEERREAVAEAYHFYRAQLWWTCSKAALQDPKYSHLAVATKGILFIGTPHRGARLATASKSWWFNSSSDIRAVLELNSQVLADLDADFLEVPRIKNREIMIASFYEKCLTQYGPAFLTSFKMHAVEKESAIFSDLPIIGLEKNHSSLVKFSSHDDPDYQRVLKELKKMYDTIEISS
ncbi:hypothetical protein G7Y89_g9934 [Cudoniella acicularis]|uniref:Uncharacterized protein n=1 Tax=Cudoniella acicularis TaxID=354080 RepID=A0A8H4RER4_9HELO|nr:hypothetical protein G7Y89_g9934 [Cudoniella acicularis]